MSKLVTAEKVKNLLLNPEIFHFQLLMGFFKLGILSSLLSDSLMSGFTTGAAVHVMTSQLPHLLGFRAQRNKPFSALIDKCL
jgi:MFS superfamily sulfate permease-like transporter